MPGVAASNSGGTRNERLIFVRGFDRFQVPLSIDGIRVYLPADNRLDYGRFLTPDIAEVQVAKGYASVLDGPGAMGGAINLVTSKPTSALEGEVRGTLNLDRGADYAGYTAYGRIGTAHDNWYAHVSFARNFQDHWELPGGYTPIANSAEDGGERDFSRTEDWRLNVKAGFTPNATDEYAISYARQEGAKNTPLHITDGVSAQRNWSWPYWNIDSIYFLSTTALGERATLKTRIYHNTFDNLLRSFDNRSQTSQTLGRAFNSYYADEAWGGSAELGVDVSEADRLTLAAHYRRDTHVEWQQSFPSGFTEPDQTNVEDSYSIALENRLAFSPTLSLTLGASYDWRDLKRAEEYGTPPTGGAAQVFSYPLTNADAFNAQGQLVWTPDEDTRLNASISSRALPDDLRTLQHPVRHRRVKPCSEGRARDQLRAGRQPQFRCAQHRRRAVLQRHSGRHRLGAPGRLSGQFEPAPESGRCRILWRGDCVDGQACPVVQHRRELHLYSPRFRSHRRGAGHRRAVFALTGVPAHKAFLYAEWKPLAGLRVLPSIDIASDRTTSTTAATPVYYRTGSYVQANLRIDYAVTETIEIGLGARNLFDDYYILTDGFPEPGRSFFLSARAKF